MESQQVRAVYNPYILHLLYVKLRYLFNVLNRLYVWKSDDFDYLVEHCVRHNHYAELLVRDLVLLRDQMQGESSPIELSLCHFEVYLLRAIQTFRTAFDPVDQLMSSGYYVCEAKLSRVIVRETHTMPLQRLLRQYTFTYYLCESDEKARLRLALFFNMKALLEKEIAQNQMNKELAFYIHYDGELVATLFYLYFISQLYCLNELEGTKVNPSLVIDHYVIKQRKLLSDSKQKASKVCQPITTDDEGARNEALLQQAFQIVYDSYHTLVIDRLKFYTKGNTTNTSSVENNSEGFLSALFASSTINESANELNYLKYLRHINREYKLKAPVTPVYSPALKHTKSKVGVSAFYNETRIPPSASGRTSIPMTYLPLKENPLLYTLCLYRMAFDVKMGEAHLDCHGATFSPLKKRTECYLCAYGKHEKENNLKLRDLIRLCQCHDLENPCNISHTTQFERLAEKLDGVHLDLMPSLSLRCFKTLTAVFWLFEFVPLAVSKDFPDKRAPHNLFRMINPTPLLRDLSRSLMVSHLDKDMWNLLCVSYKKVRLDTLLSQNPSLVSEQEHRLAMECEIVRLLADVVNMQCNEIQAYERSLSSDAKIDATHMCREVAAALKKIYIAYLTSLLQVIVDRHDIVELDL